MGVACGRPTPGSTTSCPQVIPAEEHVGTEATHRPVQGDRPGLSPCALPNDVTFSFCSASVPSLSGAIPAPGARERDQCLQRSAVCHSVGLLGQGAGPPGPREDRRVAVCVVQAASCCCEITSTRQLGLEREPLSPRWGVGTPHGRSPARPVTSRVALRPLPSPARFEGRVTLVVCLPSQPGSPCVSVGWTPLGTAGLGAPGTQTCASLCVVSIPHAVRVTAASECCHSHVWSSKEWKCPFGVQGSAF